MIRQQKARDASDAVADAGASGAHSVSLSLMGQKGLFG